MDAWGAILEKLRRLLRHKGRTGDEADDLIQEAFLRLQQYRQAKAVQQPEAFLVRIVQNLSIDAIRRDRRRGEHLAADVAIGHLIDPHPSPDEVLAGRQRLQQLRIGLDQLAPRTREIVILHRIEGYSQTQIAKRFGISVSAVEKHIAKAALFLTDWMDEEQS